MANGHQNPQWPVIMLAALALVAVGLVVAVAMTDQRLVDAERLSADLEGRLAETASAAGKAGERIGALEKAVADAKADRDALHGDALKTAAAIEATKSSLAATASAQADADQKVASLETAMTEAKAVQETLREAARKSASAIEAMKSTLDQTSSTLASARQDVAALATSVDGVKVQQDALKQDNQKITASLDAAASAVATLRSNFAWRDLLPETQSRLIAALGKSGANGVNLISISGDSESHRFATRLGAAFKAAGWSVNYVSATYPGTLVTGLVLNNAGNQATLDVAAAFQASGLDVLSAEVPRPSQSFGGADEGNPVTLVIGAHALY